MSTALRNGVQRLEITTRVTLSVLALASGVYTYLGVRELLNGSPTMVFLAALIYSVAVSIGIYAFWTFLMRVMPHVLERGGRALLAGTMLLGSLMIIAMSAWLNASALAGAAALQQHLAVSLENYTRDLDRAHNNALAAQGLLPDIQLASTRFARLADAERGGSLTGTAGSGTVVQLLTQMSTQLDGLAQKVTEAGERAKSLFDEGGKQLAKMRELISARGPVSARSDAFQAEATALMGVIASLQQTSVAPAVKRAAVDLGKGFIAPAAGGHSADLADRQTAVMGRVETSVEAQSVALAAAADKILDLAPVEPTRFQPLSPAAAVVRYADDFLPSWAGAISIDLLPAVLVLILCVAHAGIRREGLAQPGAATMTAAELLTALKLAREVGDAHDDETARVAAAAAAAAPAARATEPPVPSPPPDENVTHLAPARVAKKD